jgi:hypothetical protein
VAEYQAGMLDKPDARSQLEQLAGLIRGLREHKEAENTEGEIADIEFYVERAVNLLSSEDIEGAHRCLFLARDLVEQTKMQQRSLAVLGVALDQLFGSRRKVTGMIVLGQSFKHVPQGDGLPYMTSITSGTIIMRKQRRGFDISDFEYKGHLYSAPIEDVADNTVPNDD